MPKNEVIPNSFSIDNGIVRMSEIYSSHYLALRRDYKGIRW